VTSIVGEIVARTSDEVQVRLPAPSCVGCHSRCDTRITITLPRNDAEGLRLTLSAGNRWILLFNSLYLPLLGFFAGAVLAQWLFGDDVLTFLGSVAGFGGGMLGCRAQKLDRVLIEEVLVR